YAARARLFRRPFRGNLHRGNSRQRRQGTAMNDESPNETSAAAEPGSLRRRRFPLKIAVSAVVAVVLMGHLLQAVKDRFEAGAAGTILPAKIRAARIFSIVAEVPGSVLSISATLGDK